MDKKHLYHYGFIVLLFAMGLTVIAIFSPTKQLQMLFVLLIAICYIGWGIVHHAIHHDLTAKIVIEYVLIASLGISIILFILQGSI